MDAVLGLVLVIALPPVEFDRPYKGELTVIERSLPEVSAACGRWPHQARLFACAIPHGDKCTVILPKKDDDWVTEQQYDRLKRHELGHCNGWAGDHRGGRFD